MTTTAKPPNKKFKVIAIALCVAIGCVPCVAITATVLGAIFSAGDSSSVDESIAAKAKSDLQFAMDHGTPMESCAAASYVVAIYRDQQNVSEYEFFKGIEDTVCR